jgi:hypothetical protein
MSKIVKKLYSQPYVSVYAFMRVTVYTLGSELRLTNKRIHQCLLYGVFADPQILDVRQIAQSLRYT